METTTTPFDLSLAIQEWRDGLAQSPAIQTENRNELEAHLRDSVACLQAGGLSAEEAFLIATKRIGTTTKLGAEFRKVNAFSAWLDRVFWGVVFMQLWNIVQSLNFCFSNIFNRVLGLSPFGQTNKSSEWLRAMSLQVSVLIPMVVAALLIWRLLKSPQNRLKIILEEFSNRPGTLAGIVLLGNILFHAIYVASFFLLDSSIKFSLVAYFNTLPLYLFYSSVIFIVARKRLLRTA